MTDIKTSAANEWSDARLLNHLSELEQRLHHPGESLTEEQIAALLHPRFHEVGRSGMPYSRETVVRFLATLKVRPAVVSEGFSLTRVDAHSALLHFKSAECEALEDGTRQWVRHALRSSLWLCERNEWRLVYHQATPAAQAFVPTLQPPPR